MDSSNLIESQAEQIAHLTSTVERLTKALEPFATAEELFSSPEQPLQLSGFIDVRMNRECFRNAAQALKEARTL